MANCISAARRRPEVSCSGLLDGGIRKIWENTLLACDRNHRPPQRSSRTQTEAAAYSFAPSLPPCTFGTRKINPQQRSLTERQECPRHRKKLAGFVMPGPEMLEALAQSCLLHAIESRQGSIERRQ